MKKVLILMIVAFVFIGLANPIFSANDISVYIDGQLLQLQDRPIIQGGRTLAPMRAFFEALGATVIWESNTQTAIGKRDNITVRIPIGSTSPTINDRVETIQVAAQIIDGRTYIPLRFVGEALGDNVQWNSENRSISITRKEEPRKYYFRGREIINVIGEHYPDARLGADGLLTLELGLRFNLPTLIVDNIVWFSVEPLVDVGIITINEDGYISFLTKINPRTYSLGELIEFTNAKVRLNSIHYLNNFGGREADYGKRFALIELDVWVEKYPIYNLEWDNRDFVRAFVLENGQQLGGGLSTDIPNVVEPLTWKKAYVATLIRETDHVVEIIVVDPISRETARVLLKK